MLVFSAAESEEFEGVLHGFIGLAYTSDIHLHHFPVVCHKPVHLYFDICRLSVYGTGNPGDDQLAKHLRITLVFCGSLFRCLVLYIAPVPVRLPQMAFQSKPYSAELTYYERTAVVGGVYARMRIGMDIHHVSGLLVVVASAGCIDKPRRVVGFGPSCYLHCLELTPMLH